MTGRELKEQLRIIMLKEYVSKYPTASDHYKWKNISIPILLEKSNSLFKINVTFPNIPFKNCIDDNLENRKSIDIYLESDTASITSDKLYDLLNRYPVYNDCEVYSVIQYHGNKIKQMISNLKYNKNSSEFNYSYIVIQTTV